MCVGMIDKFPNNSCAVSAGVFHFFNQNFKYVMLIG